MTEDEARTLLDSFDGLGGPEAWIARQPWQTAPGWAVTGDMQGWRFRLAQVPGGMPVSATAPSGGSPAV
jgi:hypothetical protein